MIGVFWAFPIGRANLYEATGKLGSTDVNIIYVAKQRVTILRKQILGCSRRNNPQLISILITASYSNFFVH